MPNTGADVANHGAQRLHEAIEKMLTAPSGVTASTGVVSCGSVPQTAQSLISRADQAMYEAKRNGKRRIVHVTVD